MQDISTNDESYITQIIEIFKAVLRDKSLTEKLIVQRHLIHGTPYVFKNDENTYFDLKNKIANHFSEHFESVRMVGSGKLGFSISPSKLWQPFSDESDIDIVIVSQPVFERFWLELHDFDIALTSKTVKEQKSYEKFLKYFFKGWLRPDSTAKLS